VSSRHGVPVRGLMSTGRSPSFEGRFGRMDTLRNFFYAATEDMKITFEGLSAR